MKIVYPVTTWTSKLRAGNAYANEVISESLAKIRS